MKNLKNWMFMLVMFIATTSAFSQNKVKGTIVDGEFNMGLPGAAVILKGTQNGVSTGTDGEFELNVNNNNGTIVVSFIGYQTKTIAFTVNADKVANLGTIVLAADENMLDDIVIVGVADVAKDRKTPVAVSTIKAAVIQEKLGSQDLPALLNTTPSVYTTQGGGGFGDSNVNIRGFDQKNIAILVNGMPVNDMEGGSVYWSNWSGLADVTSAMQVQRGLGSSKIAISSVGGTINVLTRTADAKEGASLAASVGNDSYFKSTASYNTGLLENGLSASVLLGYSRGDGYVEGTDYEAMNYFFGLGYRSKDARHNVQFTFTGATQDHNQRSTSFSIENHKKWNNGKINKRFNGDLGYLNGEEFSFKGNYYTKPVASINYDFKINDTWNFGAVVYGSWGRGGGKGSIGGGPNGYRDYGTEVRDANGHVRFDDIVAWNQGQAIDGWGQKTLVANPNNPGEQGYYTTANYRNKGEGGWARRTSINSHDWYGTVMNMNAKINENWNVDFGVDARIYKGYHFQNIDNLLGAAGYVDGKNVNTGNILVSSAQNATASINPWRNMDGEQKVGYHNDGNVKWLGGFGQVEYSKNDFTAFVQGSVSNQWMQRVDYFLYNIENPKDGQPSYKTDFVSLSGGSIKGGFNYNINDYHNVFVNSGYFSRQPYMNGGVFLNNSNVENPNIQNEKIFGLEFGYGLRLEKFRANLNLYRTSWKDRVIRVTSQDIFDNKNNSAMPKVGGFATLYGVEQIHTGMEMDFVYNPIEKLSFTGSLSWGDWKYGGDVTANYYDENTNSPIFDKDENGNDLGTFATTSLYLDGVKVGGAPQFIINLGASYEIVKGLKVDGNFNYNDKFYGLVNAEDFKKPGNAGAIKLPSFNLFDAGLTYRMEVGKEKQNAVTMRLNVNNVFDTTYIASSRTNKHAAAGEATYKGVAESNEVMFGVGRQWNLTLRYNFL